MSTIVYQGLQSCLESQLIETTTLTLKLVAPKLRGLGMKGPCLLDSDTKEEATEKWHYEETNKAAAAPAHAGDNHMSSSLNLGGWNSLHSLSYTSQCPKKAMEIGSLYVHPLVERSSLPRLSEKSLELCTENLGSETGSTDTMESDIYSFSSSDLECEKSPPRELQKSRQHVSSRKVNSREFPPPLTTISGSNSIQVRRHCEGGRLIIKAVEAPSTRTCFQAERSQGRLRLSFLKSSQMTTEEDEESSADDDDIETTENVENNEENQEVDEDEEEEEEDDSEEELEAEENGGYMNKLDMDGNSFDLEVEMGMENFQRPSRCKEGGHHGDKELCKWEPFWVATS